jgi:RNA polymerase sigma-70 factor, ECF subfamily
MGQGPLSRAFLDSLPPSSRERFEPMADLEERLIEMITQGVATWSPVSADPEAYVRQLAHGVPDDPALDPEATLKAVHAADLYLACACAAGESRAITALERTYFGEVEAAANRMRAGAAVADEARQVLRQEILVPRADGPPGIAAFSGRGDLRSWIRVTAVRHLLRVLRSGRKHEEFEDDALYNVLSPAEDPELEHLKRRYREEFVTAFRDAIRALTGKQRNLLRYQAIEGLSIDQVGALYGVHRATAARWIAKARDVLLSQTRRSLMKRLGLGRSEVDSIMRLVQSRLDVSLDRFLAVTRS